jgi:hypothetical protein
MSGIDIGFYSCAKPTGKQSLWDSSVAGSGGVLAGAVKRPTSEGLEYGDGKLVWESL